MPMVWAWRRFRSGWDTAIFPPHPTSTPIWISIPRLLLPMQFSESTRLEEGSSLRLPSWFLNLFEKNGKMKSQEKVPKTTENSCYWVLLMVPVTGLEPVRHRWRWILSPLRLPFHHTGNCIFKFPLQNRSSENGGQNRRAIQKTLHIHQR